MAERRVIAAAADLPPGTGKAFAVAGRKIALFNVGGRFYAIDDCCTHDQASLAEGILDGNTIVCLLHAAEFDVTTGKVLCPPASEDVKSYPVIVSGDSIEIEL
jgi:nitrite reductase/ring-hydroxylating ferredoxin subunit